MKVNELIPRKIHFIQSQTHAAKVNLMAVMPVRYFSRAKQVILAVILSSLMCTDYSAKLVCPSCTATNIVSIGSSVFVNWAETPLVEGLRRSSGALYRCEQCRLVFRFPVPSRDELTAAYEGMPESHWNYVAPKHWAWAAKCIRELAPNRRVLDVGCFRGDFLSILAKDHECFGVEPNPAAATIASGRNITIIAKEAMDDLAGFENAFGAIVLMDVAEHLPDPAAAFRHLGKYLAPGGILLILTGNADHWLAKRSLPFYWYMAFPIHLTYLSDSYFDWFRRADGWEIARVLHYAHQNHGLLRQFRDLEKGVRVLIWRRYLAKNWAGGLLKNIRQFRWIVKTNSPPLLFCVSDHVGVVLIKNS